MSDAVIFSSEEPFLSRMKLSRQSSAVLKAKLITVRSNLPYVVILALEGDDDKIVFGQWIRRIRPGLRYEPFPCNGKKGVRALKNAVTRDLGGLSKDLFFLVDRDFDDLNGFVDAEGVFMTETYSVENCMVSEEVLDDILRDEFPCHGKPEVRQGICALFGKDYDEFLRVTAEINRRIFIARKVGIELTKPLPKSLSSLAQVRLGKVEASGPLPEKFVVYEREPEEKELSGLVDEFLLLEPRLRFRGKFAMKFFAEWLGKLAEECATGELGIFGDGLLGSSVRRAEFVLSNFASKSPIPVGLHAFVEAIS